jgi:hypothetical protein
LGKVLPAEPLSKFLRATTDAAYEKKLSKTGLIVAIAYGESRFTWFTGPGGTNRCTFPKSGAQGTSRRVT